MNSSRKMRKVALFVAAGVLTFMLGLGLAWAQARGPGMMGGGQFQQPGQQQQWGQGYGPGMMGGGYGYGPGMMGGGYGYGPGMMGGGYGYGPGMMGGGYGYGPGMMGMMMGHMMGGPGSCGLAAGPGWGLMLGRLNLSQGQWDKISQLAKERLEKMQGYMAELAKQRLELSYLLRKDQVDKGKVKDLYAKMAGLQAEMLLAGVDYMQKAKGVLSKEQLKQLQGWQ